MIGKDTSQFVDNHNNQRQVAIALGIFPGKGYQIQKETKRKIEVIQEKINKNSNFIEID